MRVVLIISLLLLVIETPCSGEFAYNLEFASGPTPHSAWYDGKPAGKVTATVKFGKLTCPDEYPEWCYQPEPFMKVELSWVDKEAWPPCEVPLFVGYVFGCSEYIDYGNGWWRNEAWDDMEISGEGSITPRHDESCWLFYFKEGWNYFDVEIGPLCPADYVMRLYTYEWPLSYEEMAECENMKEPDWYWHNMTLVKVSEEAFYMPWGCSDPLRLHDIIAIDDGSSDPEGDLDTVYAGQALSVDHNFWFTAYLRTERSEGMIPDELFGKLIPQGDQAGQELPITLTRWPDGDGTHCPGSPLTDFAYKTQGTYTPFDLWEMDREEWDGVFRPLDCCILRSDNEYRIDNSLTKRFYVVCDVALDCLNDTTVCFVPARGEEIDFRFMYCTSTGIDLNSEVTFYIKDDLERIVYTEEVGIANMPDPFSPSIYSVYLHWDGRNNGYESGRLADPDNGPYHAWVEANVGPVLTMYPTDNEDFFINPSIDSILLTHTPSYPPPGPEEEVHLYSLIRGKIHDTGDPENDYIYYSAPGGYEWVLDFWDGEDGSYNFRDLPTEPDDPGYQQFYFEDNTRLIISGIRNWRPELWGGLNYSWDVIHDWREYHGHGAGILHYDPIDTTAQWGNDWRVTLNYPENWMVPNESPYMRLLVASEILNTRNQFRVQRAETKKDYTAHKVIFVKDFDQPGLSIVDWAISHIGVPYYLDDGFAKNPYRRIECSSFVTSTRIQSFWPREEHPFRIFRILAREYAAGQYYYRGEYPSTETEVVLPSAGMHGYLIAFDDLRNTRGIEHIAIIDCVDYDPRRHLVTGGTIVHAHGNAGPLAGRVRYQDLFPEYRDNYRLTYLRWTQ